jgi:hypothetical protein
MKYSGRQATREGALGRMHAGERLAVLVYCDGGKTVEFNKKSYHIVIYCVRKTLFFYEELN